MYYYKCHLKDTEINFINLNKEQIIEQLTLFKSLENADIILIINDKEYNSSVKTLIRKLHLK